MASLHSATGTPAAFNPGVLPSSNPFLRSELAPVALKSANASAPVADSVEVTVMWGSTVLAVSQLTPPRAYAVGEVAGPNGASTSPLGKVDFALPADKLGSDRRELVTLRAGAPFAMFMASETPRVLEAGHSVDASQIIVDCSDVLPGARGIELRHDRVVIIEASGIAFRLQGCEKPETVPRAVLGNTDRSALGTMGGAALLQGLLVATLAYLTPSMAEASDDELNRDRLQLMQQYLHASAERNREEEQQKAEESGGEKGAPAEAAKGPSGKSGRADAPQVAKGIAVAGDSPLRSLARQELIKEAQSFGMVGMLSTLNGSNAPSSPWGDIANGPDTQNAHGDLFSQDIGDAFGYGVGLSGTGQGGGGRSDGSIGIDGVTGGNCMGVNCLGTGKDGWGRGVGRLGGKHETSSPKMRPGITQVSGRLPSEVIQRIVRQNFGRFRQCYETGLRSNPNLEGRVAVRFVIGRDGAVSNVSGGGDLPNAQVTSCVASAFYGLSFPAPDNGIVTVTYPILLTPG
jgi:hypothetical protein